MFERYTEGARRVIFFARREASQDGDSSIRLIHLLAGLRDEIPQQLEQVGLSRKLLDRLRASGEFGKRGSKRVPASAEMPMERPARRALALAAALAERARSFAVTPAHLLLAVSQVNAKLRKRLVKGRLDEKKLRALVGKQSRSPGEAAGKTLRAGIGYDLHRLEPGRRLVLGGIKLAFDRGPVGHSDGDVLSHAICDAVLGAAGLGDIGTHFPDTDPKWKGVSSLVFLEQVRRLLDERSLRIVHIDAVVICERPRLGPHFPAMRQALARALGILPEQINLKAKTHEGLGELGRSEAIAAQAVATLEG
jgi:2-C-methyl-D-erythritol 2,4-cyclodiphosphate synthase